MDISGQIFVFDYVVGHPTETIWTNAKIRKKRKQVELLALAEITGQMLIGRGAKAYLRWSQKLIHSTLRKKTYKRKTSNKLQREGITWNQNWKFWNNPWHTLFWVNTCGMLLRSPEITTGMLPHSCDSFWAFSRRSRIWKKEICIIFSSMLYK